MLSRCRIAISNHYIMQGSFSRAERTARWLVDAGRWGHRLSQTMSLARRPIAGLLAVAGCVVFGGLVAGAEEVRPGTDQATVSQGICEIPGFPVSWSAPKRVVAPMKIRNGLPTFSCSMNGHVVWLILDTGSQVCLLEAETARAAEVRLVAAALARVDIAGVRGNETARVGVPESISIGAWRLQGQPFVVRTAPSRTPAGWFSGRPVTFNILGMSALRAMCSYVTLDYARHEIIFGFGPAFHPVAPAVAAHQAFELRNGLPFVNVACGGHQWAALVDTGASAKLEILPVTAKQVRSSEKSRWIKGAQMGLGQSSVSNTQRFECFTLGSVDCLGRRWRNVDAMLVENEAKIGSGMYQASRLTFDFSSSQIWLEPPASGRQ